MKKISLIRIKFNNIYAYKEQINRIRNIDAKVMRVQLCLLSSQLNSELVSQIGKDIDCCEKYIIRMEVDSLLDNEILHEIFKKIYQIVLIAGNHFYASIIESECKNKGYNYRNYVENGISEIGRNCHVKDNEKDVYLTELKLYNSLCEYADLQVNSEKKFDDEKEVVLVSVQAGLAQQIYMYLLACRLNELTHKTIIINDFLNSVWNTSEKQEDFVYQFMSDFHVSYENAKEAATEERKSCGNFYYKRLEIASVFGSKFRLLSEYFTEYEWDGIINKASVDSCNTLSEIYEKMGYEMTVVRDHAVKDYDNNLLSCVYESDLRDIYFDGAYEIRETKRLLDSYFTKNIMFELSGSTGDLDEQPLLRQRAWIQSVIRIPMITDEKNNYFLEEIKNSYSVVIHYRKGGLKSLNIEIDDSYYRKTISELIKDDIDNKNEYFIFSDNIEWCKEHECELGFDLITENLHYVDGNEGKNSYIDLILMSNGKIVVPSPDSTFSICAIFLGICKKYVDCRFYKKYKKIRMITI